LPIAKFLHTADLHLSRPFGFLPPQLAEERRRDQRRTLTKIADLAIERAVDLLLISGDLFDSPDPDPTDLEAVTKEFSRVAETGVKIFALPGNHDPISQNSFWRRLDIPGLHVFSEANWNTVRLDKLGVAVCGTAFDRSNSERRAFEGLKTPDDLPTIVMAHASYEVFEGQLERYHPFSVNELKTVRAAYIALGHYHKYNALNVVGTTACYPGTPEGISFDSVETEDRHVIIGTVRKDGTSTVEPVKINSRVMRSAEIDCTSFDSQTSLFDAVRKLCDPIALVELKLTGAPTPEIEPILRDLPERFRESCAYLTVDTEDISITPDLECSDRTIRGRFCQELVAQIEATADPDRRRVLKRALELGLAAFAEK